MYPSRLRLIPLPSYTSDDPIGVELAGAMKNVYAIVAVGSQENRANVATKFCQGAADGLGFENNTRACGWTKLVPFCR